LTTDEADRVLRVARMLQKSARVFGNENKGMTFPAP